MKNQTIESVTRQLERARVKHANMNSLHEGYAVILEELDEVWECVRRDDRDGARKEVLHVAAMALRFYEDL